MLKMNLKIFIPPPNVKKAIQQKVHSETNRLSCLKKITTICFFQSFRSKAKKDTPLMKHCSSQEKYWKPAWESQTMLCWEYWSFCWRWWGCKWSRSNRCKKHRGFEENEDSPPETNIGNQLILFSVVYISWIDNILEFLFQWPQASCLRTNSFFRFFPEDLTTQISFLSEQLIRSN